MKSNNNAQTRARKRLLISLAHPDDESFGMGGAIARYADEGVEVSLICSTNGDVGTVDSEFLQGYDTIADLRLDELRCAAETLGVTEVITYGHRDSGMEGAADNRHPDALCMEDEAVIVERIVRDIRRIRPQVVVTFDEFGGYGHPDHRYMHRTTTRAFHLAGDPDQFPQHRAEGLEPYQPAKLYYTGFPKGQLRLWIWRERLAGHNPRKIGKNHDLDLIESMKRIGPTHAKVYVAPYQSQWDKAAACHAAREPVLAGSAGGTVLPSPGVFAGVSRAERQRQARK